MDPGYVLTSKRIMEIVQTVGLREGTGNWLTDLTMHSPIHLRGIDTPSTFHGRVLAGDLFQMLVCAFCLFGSHLLNQLITVL